MEEIYKQCFFEYFEGLFHYAFTIIKDNAEAKDIVQTAFVKLWENRDKVNLAASAQGYLYTAVYHLSLNTIRDRKNRAGHHQYLITGDSTNNSIAAEEKETSKRIQQAIAMLPSKCKEVFTKSRFEAKKYAVIAAEMNISVKTVEVHMGKALKHLREQLSDLVLIFCLYLLI